VATQPAADTIAKPESLTSKVKVYETALNEIESLLCADDFRAGANKMQIIASKALAAAERLPPETPASTTEQIDWKAAYVEAIRQRDALQTDANRYRWLRDFTYVEAYWIDGAGGIDEIRLQGSVHFLDKAVDLERVKDQRPALKASAPARPASFGDCDECIGGCEKCMPSAKTPEQPTVPAVSPSMAALEPASSPGSAAGTVPHVMPTVEKAPQT